ncbi:hypothetical protein HN51_041736 [Arachis hypogaea]
MEAHGSKDAQVIEISGDHDETRNPGGIMKTKLQMCQQLAILIDAAHLLSDVAAFAISLFSLWAAGWEANPRQSYGYFRIEILGALVSIQLIWLLAGILVYKAVDRMVAGPREVDGSFCIWSSGGALKPTDIDTLWVHVTCAWFRPEVAFASDEKMEPALGILSIPSSSFVKICVICKQIHGSCTQCCKCSTYFHAMCASRAGYRMELHISEKNGKQTTKMVSYCAYHRAPNPDTVLIMQTPLGVISTKSLLQTKKKTGSRLISSRRTKVEETPQAEDTEHEPFSAARCRIFQRTNYTKKKSAADAVPHHVRGPYHHPLDAIQSLNAPYHHPLRAQLIVLSESASSLITVPPPTSGTPLLNIDS